MYNNNNNRDPFAGQYPPPPPLEPQVQQPEQPYYNNNNSYLYDTNVYSPPPIVPHPPVNAYYPSEPQPPAQQYYNIDEERHIQGVNNQPLDSYLRQEREEYLKQSQSTKPTNQIIPLNSNSSVKLEEEDLLVAEKTPMMAASDQKPSRKERKRIEKIKKDHEAAEASGVYYGAPTTGYTASKPMPPPENEPESYRYRPHEEKPGNNCCCCYNPAITCCSFFCLLISCAFLAAGIALMIAAKVVSDKCNNQCGDMIEQAQSACGTICSKVLHDGMFYGGIVVAGLAGIAIIWKLIMWTCAGYSKK
jgi:hypothetical protein